MIPEPVLRNEIKVNSLNFEQTAMIKTERRKRGRPKGSKNKSKPTSATKTLPDKQVESSVEAVKEE